MIRPARGNIKHVLILGLFLLGTVLSNCKRKVVHDSDSNGGLKAIGFAFKEVKGIGLEQGVTRRDPSDVIEVNDVYYVYYTKVIGKSGGYWGDLWYASSKDKGHTWKEEGQILGIGEKGAFDSQAVFTPNIIKGDNTYYLFYTGVKPTPGRTDGVFENNSTTDVTALGLAVSNNPDGPFKRISIKPILEVSEDPEKFDSYRIDDASLLFKDGKYLLFYKGRSRSHGAGGPAHTQMGVAVADIPEGPYIKNGSPILDNGHEVMIWHQGKGVATLASISSTLEYSKTGLDFITDRKAIKVENRPYAPGAYRADLTGGESNKLEWGISMVHNKADSYLIRYDVKDIDTAVSREPIFEKGTFGYDMAFLKKNYKKSIVLESNDHKSMLVLSPELQGRVMTSTLNGDQGSSFGWLNYDLIASKEVNEHINPTGGEERFWLGPEGGQYSIYFNPGVPFDFENWYVPAELDTEGFDIVEHNLKSAVFHKEFNLINYSGTKLEIDVTRTVSLLHKGQVKEALQLATEDFSVVAYETSNNLKNIGASHWKKETGLLSIWLLSMFTPSPETTVIIPIKEGTNNQLGAKVKDDYFGKVASDRLKKTERTIFFKADGNSRGKIGISPLRATKFMGSYDAKNETLTILEIEAPNTTAGYVNSTWKIQEDPYSGDVLNSYNDGPLEDGSQMGPFYELESSSPALALASGESYTHTQRIYHINGEKEIINQIAEKILGVTIEEIKVVFN